MLRKIEWMKKMGLTSRLVWVSVILTAALLRTASVYGASEPGGVSGGQALVALTVPLKDIAGHWAKAAIETAVDKGYVKGYPDGTFKPGKEVTRAEFVKMAADSLHLPVDAAAAGAKWYAPYIAALKDAGMLADSDLGAGWDGKMNRTEMAKLLTRGSDDSVRGKKLADGEALYKAVSAGLIGGLPDGTLNEKGTMTRAEAVTVIERLATVRGGGKLTADKYALQNAAILYKGTNLEEAWGVKPVALPSLLDLDPRVDLTLNKMIIIDLDDPKSPMRSKFKGLESKTEGGMLTKDYYIIAYNFTLENKKEQARNMWNIFAGKIIPSISDWNYGVVYPDEKVFTHLPTIWLDEITKVNGWYLVSIRKNIAEKYPERKMPLFITYRGTLIWLGERNN
ncbi:S-layer homology domain-containing protein [Cohnella sp. 56]|uniref:S-layer homology domain-containing protein n=1 Tax=Cohnella sp. 56 TaxID=3113722 RepID=UPI0030E80CA1